MGKLTLFRIQPVSRKRAADLLLVGAAANLVSASPKDREGENEHEKEADPLLKTFEFV